MVRIVAPAGTLPGRAGRWRAQNAQPARAISVGGHGYKDLRDVRRRFRQQRDALFWLVLTVVVRAS
ncbi:hypothetical protein Acy02nite_53710 [Actinoplanes cyaneus]|uniref:Uncharacterized protein n=1 Tax=Actinoplanes cyaneus TaxID=52696 RepID=A0A919M2Q0_9ACTN|nr:hypothetical protein Acy02nite_53710 [Actinoplanes cyaneus]